MKIDKKLLAFCFAPLNPHRPGQHWGSAPKPRYRLVLLPSPRSPIGKFWIRRWMYAPAPTTYRYGRKLDTRLNSLEVVCASIKRVTPRLVIATYKRLIMTTGVHMSSCLQSTATSLELPRLLHKHPEWCVAIATHVRCRDDWCRARNLHLTVQNIGRLEENWVCIGAKPGRGYIWHKWPEASTWQYISHPSNITYSQQQHLFLDFVHERRDQPCHARCQTPHPCTTHHVPDKFSSDRGLGRASGTKLKLFFSCVCLMQASHVNLNVFSNLLYLDYLNSVTFCPGWT